MIARWCAVMALACLCLRPAVAATPRSDVLAVGLAAIHQDALADFAVSTLAVEGMKGLSTIDPDFGIVVHGHFRLTVMYGSHHVADYYVPKPNDADGWAALIRRTVTAVAPLSPAIAAAPPERIDQAVFDAALALLDVFSRYAGPAEAQQHRAARNGFGGIGVRIEPDGDTLRVTDVSPNGPAAGAGFKAGDRIVAIDGASVAGLSRDAVAAKLRGPINSTIVLSVRRQGWLAVRLVTLHRALVVPRSVTSHVDEGGIVTITIAEFNADTGRAVAAVLKTARQGKPPSGIILDLRGNPGGLLEQGVAVAGQFLAKGPIVATRGRHPASIRTYFAGPGGLGGTLPLAVLIDGGTASAAEIVAAALEDSGRAVLIGTTSFGKGTIQTVLTLPNDGELTLTWSRFITPSGYALHGLGVLPTVCTAGEPTRVDAPLAPLRSDRADIAATIAAWRSVRLDDAAGRAHLRTHCPPSIHAAATIDEAVARRLLGDPALLAGALALTAPVADTALRP
jgi:carboxyl-terminal processing protease